MRYLLDKNIVRYALVGLRFDGSKALSFHEQASLIFIQKAYLAGSALFISHKSYSIIKQWLDYREVNTLLNVVDVLYPTRYNKRWARRIRETSGLTPEDSAITALATFGAPKNGAIIGVNSMITFDQGLINGFNEHQQKLDKRLNRMTSQLNPPYKDLLLPIVHSPVA